MMSIFKVAVFCSLFSSILSAQTTIFTEDFQQGIPSDWTIVINDTNTVNPAVSEFAPGWISLPDPNNTSDTVAGATSYFTTPARADRWLITPAITLGAFGNYVSWQARSHDPSFAEDYLVLISKTDTQLASFTDTVALIPQELEDWTSHDAKIVDSLYHDSTVYIAFVIRSYDAFKLYLDDVVIRIEDPLSINELLSETEVVIYPNPARETLSFQSKSTIKSITIYSLQGQEIAHYQGDYLTKIDISTLNSGSYITIVETNSGIVQKRFMKE